MFRFNKIVIISTDTVYGPLHGMTLLPCKRKHFLGAQFYPVYTKLNGDLSHWQFLRMRASSGGILTLWENGYNEIKTMSFHCGDRNVL